MDRSITVLPKPRRVGGFTGGPPCSDQSIVRCPSASSAVAISTRPMLSLSAPYLAELVIISWMTSAIVVNACGSISTSGPLMTTRSALAARYAPASALIRP